MAKTRQKNLIILCTKLMVPSDLQAMLNLKQELVAISDTNLNIVSFLYTIYRKQTVRGGGALFIP